MLEKRKIAALVAEFLGAGVLTLLVLTVQRSTIGVPFFVAIAAGLSIVLMGFAVGGVSGGHFNPAISIGLWTARKLTTLRTILYVAAQLLGGYAAYLLYTYFVGNALQSVGGQYSGKVLVAEAVGAGIFGFAFAAIVFKDYSRPVKASFAGLGLIIGIIAASSASLGLINPAVALGVKAWVWGTYVLGPILGAIIGINLYALLFAEAGSSNVAKAVAGVSKKSAKPAKKSKK